MRAIVVTRHVCFFAILCLHQAWGFEPDLLPIRGLGSRRLRTQSHRGRIERHACKRQLTVCEVLIVIYCVFGCAYYMRYAVVIRCV